MNGTVVKLTITRFFAGIKMGGIMKIKELREMLAGFNDEALVYCCGTGIVINEDKEGNVILDTMALDDCTQEDAKLRKLIKQAEAGDEFAAATAMNYLDDSALKLFGKVAMKTVETILSSTDGAPFIELNAVGIYKDGDKWIAFDNKSRDCWVEEFTTFKKAFDYLDGDNEVIYGEEEC